MLEGWFGRRPTKASLQEHKTVNVGGMSFVIRRINPLIDFQPGQIPMVFGDTTRAAKTDASSPSAHKKLLEDMYAVVQAGVVEPKLEQAGKPGINVEDVFRDPEVGARLYAAIIEHSLLRFQGVRRPLFFLARLLSRFITLHEPMGSGPATSHSKVSISA